MGYIIICIINGPPLTLIALMPLRQFYGKINFKNAWHACGHFLLEWTIRVLSYSPKATTQTLLFWIWGHFLQVINS